MLKTDKMKKKNHVCNGLIREKVTHSFSSKLSWETLSGHNVELLDYPFTNGQISKLAKTSLNVSGESEKPIKIGSAPR